jgi:hypothetical protein
LRNVIADVDREWESRRARGEQVDIGKAGFQICVEAHTRTKSKELLIIIFIVNGSLQYRPTSMLSMCTTRKRLHPWPRLLQASEYLSHSLDPCATSLGGS